MKSHEAGAEFDFILIQLEFFFEVKLTEKLVELVLVGKVIDMVILFNFLLFFAVPLVVQIVFAKFIYINFCSILVSCDLLTALYDIPIF